MIDTSGSEKTCSPILCHFVSWSGLIVFLFVVRSWFDCTNTQKADLLTSSCNEKWEKIRQVRAEAGRKGGAQKGNQNAAKQKQTKQANACFAKQKQAKTSKNKQNKL